MQERHTARLLPVAQRSYRGLPQSTIAECGYGNPTSSRCFQESKAVSREESRISDAGFVGGEILTSHLLQENENPVMLYFSAEEFGTPLESASDWVPRPHHPFFSDELSPHPTESTQLLLMFEKSWAAFKLKTVYKCRIDHLRKLAQDEEEWADFNPSSENDFWLFIELRQSTKKADLVLLENGNLRAIWEESDETYLAIEFQGGMRVEYVIFKRRPKSKHVSRVVGSDSFDGLLRQIEAFGLDVM